MQKYTGTIAQAPEHGPQTAQKIVTITFMLKCCIEQLLKLEQNQAFFHSFILSFFDSLIRSFVRSFVRSCSAETPPGGIEILPTIHGLGLSS